jgi:histidinol-phosphatase (PHP family)
MVHNFRSAPKSGGNFSSLHTHTLFCDGADDVETMCRAAFEKGLCAIGFSAHGPIFAQTGLQTDWHLDEGRLQEYLAEVRAAGRRWEGRVAVYLGLEMDYIKGLRSALDRDIQALGLDYLIGSVHYIVPPSGKPFAIDGSPEELEQGIADGFGGDGEALMHAYWDAVAEMIALGGFDILGHADLVKKNNTHGGFFNMESGAFRQRLAETARDAAAAGLVVEVNTGGLNRNRSGETYPSLSFLRLFREQNTPALMSADAHCAAHLDGHYETAGKTLREAGYTTHVLFEGRKNGKAVWKTEQLPAFLSEQTGQNDPFFK